MLDLLVLGSVGSGECRRSGLGPLRRQSASVEGVLMTWKGSGSMVAWVIGCRRVLAGVDQPDLRAGIIQEQVYDAGHAAKILAELLLFLWSSCVWSIRESSLREPIRGRDRVRLNWTRPASTLNRRPSRCPRTTCGSTTAPRRRTIHSAAASPNSEQARTSPR